jgi:hypothetical protein
LREEATPKPKHQGDDNVLRGQGYRTSKREMVDECRSNGGMMISKGKPTVIGDDAILALRKLEVY